MDVWTAAGKSRRTNLLYKPPSTLYNMDTISISPGPISLHTYIHQCLTNAGLTLGIRFIRPTSRAVLPAPAPAFSLSSLLFVAACS